MRGGKVRGESKGVHDPLDFVEMEGLPSLSTWGGKVRCGWKKQYIFSFHCYFFSSLFFSSTSTFLLLLMFKIHIIHYQFNYLFILFFNCNLFLNIFLLLHQRTLTNTIKKHYHH